MTTLLRDRVTSRAWLEFAGRPDAPTIAALKAVGWRWSGYRKAWHNPRKGILPPAGLEYEDGGLCDYSGERADRLDAAAGKAEERSEAAHRKVRAIADMIPFGQPILVGHHSEGRHRRDADRIHDGMRKTVDEGRKAEHLAQLADGSRRRQEQANDPGVISRRLDKLRADLRARERALTNELARSWTDAQRVAYEANTVPLREEIARNEAEFAKVAPPPLEVNKGDVVRIRGHVVLVYRANLKTISGEIIEGGARGMSGKWDRSWLQEIVRRAAAPAKE